MLKVEFKYKNALYNIQAKEDDKMREICNKFTQKALIDINDIYFEYLCEKSKEWIKNNVKLLDEAQKNKGAFAKLIKKLKSDKILRGGERVDVYKDICMHYWGPNQMFGITCDKFNFLGEIWECDPLE